MCVHVHFTNGTLFTDSNSLKKNWTPYWRQRNVIQKYRLFETSFATTFDEFIFWFFWLIKLDILRIFFKSIVSGTFCDSNMHSFCKKKNMTGTFRFVHQRNQQFLNIHSPIPELVSRTHNLHFITYNNWHSNQWYYSNKPFRRHICVKFLNYANRNISIKYLNIQYTRHLFFYRYTRHRNYFLSPTFPNKRFEWT